MAVVALTGKTQAFGVPYTHTTASSADWAAVANDTYFYDLTDKLVYHKNSGGSVLTMFSNAVPNVLGISDATGVYTYYADYTAAIAAASSGDIIEQFADIVVTTVTPLVLPAGVKVNGRGHKLTYTTATAVIIFTTGDGCAINNLNVIKENSATQVNNYCVSVLNATTVNLEGSYFESTVRILHCAGIARGGKYKMKTDALWAHLSVGVYITASGTLSDAYVESEQQVVTTCYTIQNYGRIDNVRGKSYNITAIRNQNYAINCHAISTNNSAGATSFASQGTSINCSAFADGHAFNTVVGDNCSGYSVAGYGFLIATGGRYNNCSGYSEASYGAYCNTASAKLQNCSFQSAGNYAMYMTANSDFFNCSFYSSTSYSVWGTATGEFHNCTFHTVAAGVTFGCIYFNGCSFQCDWNNVSGNGARVNNGATFIDNKFKLANASAYCLTFGSPVSARIVGNKFDNSTTPIHANITQTSVGTTDSQGNITV